jgi:hypothetical protein
MSLSGLELALEPSHGCQVDPELSVEGGNFPDRRMGAEGEALLLEVKNGLLCLT